MKLCIYSASQQVWGGGQIYIESLCNYLNENGIDSFISTSEPESFNCKTILMSYSENKVKRIKGAIHLLKSLKKNNISMIMLNDLSALWLAPIFRIFRFKVISLLHVYLKKRDKYGLGYSGFEYHLLRFSSLFCHRIYSVNKNNVDLFPVKIEFIGNFVPNWFFSEQPEQKKYDLGVISRLSKEKNILLFLKIIANLKKCSSRKVRALIVGEGDELDNILKNIDTLGLVDNIDIRPWVERKLLPNVYDEIKCFAITSYHEGFSTTLLEAHARGVPAIVTDTCGYCVEFLNGEHGQSFSGSVINADTVDSDQTNNRILGLIDNYSDYYFVCINKAKSFREDVILDKFLSSLKNVNDYQS